MKYDMLKQLNKNKLKNKQQKPQIMMNYKDKKIGNIEKNKRVKLSNKQKEEIELIKLWLKFKKIIKIYIQIEKNLKTLKYYLSFGKVEIETHQKQKLK